MAAPTAAPVRDRRSARTPQAAQPPGGPDVAPSPVVPFVAAAHEHTEPFVDTTVVPGAAMTQLGPFDVPAYGYARHIFMEVTASGGALGAGVLAADYPFNLFQAITFSDVNGAPIYGPLSGYQSLWANIAGGYAFQSDPRKSPWFVSTINAAFPLRVPLEISHHDGLGSLANQNSAASYKLTLNINPSSILYTTAPTTVPTFRIRCYLEAWSLPNEVDPAGRPQAQAPPALGTAQFWSVATKGGISAGNQQILLPRVGNLIRNLIFISRSNAANSPRDNTVFPNPAIISWDQRSILNDTQGYRQQIAFERLANITALDTGVFLYQFNHSVDNLGGDDAPTLWLPTVQSTRLELDGTNTTAGTIEIITNDIALGEVRPAERYVESSETGFHPQVGVANPSRV